MQGRFFFFCLKGIKMAKNAANTMEAMSRFKAFSLNAA